MFDFLLFRFIYKAGSLANLRRNNHWFSHDARPRLWFDCNLLNEGYSAHRQSDVLLSLKHASTLDLRVMSHRDAPCLRRRTRTARHAKGMHIVENDVIERWAGQNERWMRGRAPYPVLRSSMPRTCVLSTGRLYGNYREKISEFKDGKVVRDTCTASTSRRSLWDEGECF